MHDTNIKMKDGRVFCASIYKINIKKGFIRLFGVDEDLYFDDMVYAITENERISINKIGNVDEIERYRKNRNERY